MKAKEYFEKYHEAIWAEAQANGAPEDGPTAMMYADFAMEIKDIIKQRNIQFDRAIPGIVRELNQKWNAVANMFEKKYGASPIARDGFAKAIKKQLNSIESGEK